MSKKRQLTVRQHYHALYDFLKGHAHQWWEIGINLKFYHEELSLIRSNPVYLTHPNPTLGYFGEMLSRWLQWAPGDGRKSADFARFEDLREALLKVDGIAAHTLDGIEKVLVPLQPVEDRSNNSCLSEKHHLKICKYLHLMKDSQIILLGQALGLKRSNLKKMKTLPDDMVDAWLNREDDVLTTSGPPTWESLCRGLREIDQNGIAHDIELKEVVVADRITTSDRRLLESDIPKLMEKLSPYADKWWQIGTALGFTNELNVIRAKPGLFYGAPASYLADMLSEWVQWTPETVHKTYATVGALKQALRSDLVGLGTVAVTLLDSKAVVTTPKGGNQQATCSSPTAVTTIKYVDKSPPNHSDTFKTMLSVAAKWEDIGSLLNPPLPKGRMESIKKEQMGNNIGCIREMLSEWFRQIDPRPTWTALAEAVEPFDPSKAKQIRKKYCVQSPHQ